jgi:sulfofructose kinase
MGAWQPGNGPKRVVGVGANAVDAVYLLPHAPAPSGPRAKLRIRRHFVSCGGQVATSLATCTRLGLETQYIGAIGSDSNGARIRQALVQAGVGTMHVVTRAGENPAAVILIDETTGERIVLWDRGPLFALDTAEVPEALIASADLLHVDDVDLDASIHAATLARSHAVPVTSDIERIEERTEELVRAVTHPIFGEDVAVALSGCADHEAALRKIRAHNAGVLCVTLGAAGSIALDGDRIIRAPGIRVAAVDTTGAGDVFRGAFIYSILAGRSTADTLRFANAAAAASCTKFGAISAVPTLAEALALAAEPSTAA